MQAKDKSRFGSDVEEEGGEKETNFVVDTATTTADFLPFSGD